MYCARFAALGRNYSRSTRGRQRSRMPSDSASISERSPVTASCRRSAPSLRLEAVVVRDMPLYRRVPKRLGRERFVKLEAAAFPVGVVDLAWVAAELDPHADLVEDEQCEQSETADAERAELERGVRPPDQAIEVEADDPGSEYPERDPEPLECCSGGRLVSFLRSSQGPARSRRRGIPGRRGGSPCRSPGRSRNARRARPA